MQTRVAKGEVVFHSLAEPDAAIDDDQPRDSPFSLAQPGRLPEDGVGYSPDWRSLHRATAWARPQRQLRMLAPSPLPNNHCLERRTQTSECVDVVDAACTSCDRCPCYVFSESIDAVLYPMCLRPTPLGWDQPLL
jgi:hypothetical protein